MAAILPSATQCATAARPQSPARVPDSERLENRVRLARVRAAPKERIATTRSFWDAVALPDATLIEYLLGSTFDASVVDNLFVEYPAAFLAAQASELERESVENQLEFIEAVAVKVAGGARSRALSVVRRLREQLARPQPAAAQTGAAKQATKRIAPKRGAPKKPAAKKPARKPARKPKAPARRRRPGIS
jgi:hypothetical protein